MPPDNFKHVQQQNNKFDFCVFAKVFVTSIILGNEPGYIKYDSKLH